jgi:hypothetical protein
MKEFIIVHKMLIGKSESKSPLGRFGFGCKDIKIKKKNYPRNRPWRPIGL